MYVMPGSHELPVFLLPAGEQLLHLLQLCLERLGLAAHDVELAL